jgi:hypothetical protein
MPFNQRGSSNDALIRPEMSARYRVGLRMTHSPLDLSISSAASACLPSCKIDRGSSSRKNGKIILKSREEYNKEYHEAAARIRRTKAD